LSVILTTEERGKTDQSLISKRSDKFVQRKVSNDLKYERIRIMSKDDYAHEIAFGWNKELGKLIITRSNKRTHPSTAILL
jgi:hypothetical protein